MSDRDDGPPPGDAPLDLSAWVAPPPPRGLAGRVMTAVRAGASAPDVTLDTGTPAPVPGGGRRWAGVVGGVVLGVAVAAAAWTMWPRGTRSGPSAGHVVAAAPSKITLGSGSVALLTAGADITWRRDGDTLAVTHSAGAITYQHGGPLALVVTTPAGTVHTARATFLLEVPVKKQLIAGVVGAGLATAVVVAVYEGKAEVREPATAPRVVEGGEQVALAAPAPAAPPPFQTIAKAAKDRGVRDALAAAIAQARAGGGPTRAAGPGGSVGGTGGIAGRAAAPQPGAPVVDETPGELSKDEIRTGVREVVPMLTDCYAAMVDKYPTLGGRVMARLTVDSEPDLGTIVTMGDDSQIEMAGAAAGVDRKELDADLGEFRQCLTATLESVVLPPLGDKDGGHVEINYPFVFTNNEDEEEAATTPPPAEKRVASADPGKKLLEDAETAAKMSEWGRALHLAESALTKGTLDSRGQGQAHLIAALASCNLKNERSARRHYLDIAKASQVLVRQRCLSNGIDPVTPPAATAAELLQRSEDAAKRSQWKRALSDAEAAVAAPDADTQLKARAHMVAALAACNLKDVARARAHFAGATPSSKTLIRLRCEANKVKVD